MNTVYRQFATLEALKFVNFESVGRFAQSVLETAGYASSDSDDNRHPLCSEQYILTRAVRLDRVYVTLLINTELTRLSVRSANTIINAFSELMSGEKSIREFATLFIIASDIISYTAHSDGTEPWALRMPSESIVATDQDESTDKFVYVKGSDRCRFAAVTSYFFVFTCCASTESCIHYLCLTDVIALMKDDLYTALLY
jgi:hypothetical protein